MTIPAADPRRPLASSQSLDSLLVLPACELDRERDIREPNRTSEALGVGGEHNSGARVRTPTASLLFARATQGLMILGLLASAAFGQDETEEVVDFSDQITATCELIGLVAVPPEGWINVPIETPTDELIGCQMMRINDQQELVGVIRLLSTAISTVPAKEDWFARLSRLEVSALERMGLTLGEPMWARDNVPVSGPGFESGKAAGFAATIAGNEIPQEVHFLGFGTSTTKYLMTLSTPGREVEAGVYYQRNTSDFGTLIQTLQRPDSR